MPTFGERFKSLRSEKNLKQEELINEFNQKFHFSFTKSAISQYENDKRIPEIQALNAFADYFNVSVDYLLGRSNEKNGKIKKDESYYSTTDRAKEILAVFQDAGIKPENIDLKKLEQLLQVADIETKK